MDYKNVSIETLNKGAIPELFEEAWRRLMENIADGNTSARATRQLTLTIKVKPNDKRDNATTTVSVVERLAPINPHEHYVLLSSDGKKLQAFTADPKQADLGLEVEETDNITQFRPAAGGR